MRGRNDVLLPPPKITPKIHRNVGTSFFVGAWQVFPTTSFKLKKKKGEKNVLGCFHIYFFINEKNAHVFQQQPKKTLKFRVFSTTKFLTTSSLPEKQLLNFLLQNLLLLHQRCILYLQLIYLWFAIHHQITMMKLIQIAQKIIYKCKEGQKELFSGQGFPPRFKWSSRLSPIYP